MSRTETGFQDFEAAAHAHDPGFPTELWSLLRTISTQIDEADQRHTGLLQELRDRLSTLSRDAEDARGSVPASAAPVYERIESGIAELAQRIDAMDDGATSGSATSAAPAALRSASHFADERAPVASSIDPFDVVGDDDGDQAVWAPSDAEALTRVYEESDAALVRISPRSQTPSPAPAWDNDPASQSVAGPEHTASADPLQLYTAVQDSTAGDSVHVDRQWLDQRLSDIALRIEQSLGDLRPDFGVNSLGVRFDAFEERMGSVLGDVATRTDVESLRILEDNLQDLALHLEQTERQLGRLDGIEQQLQAVIEYLSDGTAAGGSANSIPNPDFKSLATATAEAVAQRFAGSMGPAGGDARIDELGSLLRSMIHDRRHSDEQTYTMLDTVQQAMIRLLDRIDAMEMAHIQNRLGGQPVFAGPAGIAQSGAAALFDPAHRPVAEHSEPGRAYSSTPHYAPPHPTPPALPTMESPVPATPAHAEPLSIDKLRQDFIADAQRAKMRAAAAPDPAEGAPAQAPALASRAARAAPRGQGPTKTAGSDASAPGASTRKQRLTALALCLVIAVSGAALFVKRTKAPQSAQPASVTETMPETPANSELAPVAESEGEVINVPGPSKSEAPVAGPAASEGAGFEVPAEATVPVPAPVVPNGGAGASGIITHEGALDLNGGAPSEGQVLQNRYETETGPHGIILQNGARKPTVPELVQLQSQQNVATLSSRLGATASQLSPADLMPEEVARYSVVSVAATPDDVAQAKAQPASLSVAAMPGQSVNVPVTGGAIEYSQSSLPPATVGPLSLRLAAANGDPSAAFEVGARLAEGKGTSQDFAEAITWYQKSAAKGFAQAQYRLGTLYERGLGVKADAARAQMWYQRAADQGHIKAMHNLAVLSAGRAGAPDYMTAARWFESAASYGLSDSQYNLAVLYENGLGVSKDAVQAFKWFALAARGGDGEATRRRDALKLEMTTEQRADAESAIATFGPKRSEPIVNDARVAGEDWKKRQNG